MDSGEIWELGLEHARKFITEQAFEAWLKPITPATLDGSTLNLLVPNQFFRDYFEDRFRPVLAGALREATGLEINFRLIVNGGGLLSPSGTISK